MEIDEEKQKELEQMEEERKNHGFAQVYNPGWDRLASLAKTIPQAVELYTFLAKHMDPACGAVVADQQFLADHMEPKVSVRTIRRWVKQLEDCKAIVRIPVTGRVCAYALNPYEVWKGYNTAKDYAAFNTKTLVNYDGDIKRRLMSMFEGSKKAQKSEQTELEEQGQQRLFN